MTSSPPGAFTRDIPFSDADFRAIAQLAQQRFGLSLAESKKPLVYSRLSRRLKSRQVGSFTDYLALLERSEEEAERLELISALTTNVTSFFREKHHFDTLTQRLAEGLAERANSGQRVRIWSAGCSSGQEPYSIAMTVLEAVPEAARKDLRILATDIDPKIVHKARDGVYSAEDVAGIPAPMRGKWTKATDASGKTYGVTQALKDLITFNELNLMVEWPFRGPFDAIFCRNVAIYFDQETQRRLWQRFSAMLNPDGLLFIGHSERVTGQALKTLTGFGITSYRKARTNVPPALQ
ncbi:CheR family methyltransferase [Mameliella alba]|uniref:CheR family methyltransferase n=1 Tax=Mameliella alba TaxID=561184 RepID=UPI000B536A91|nr:protein-glutamate O-methyltransferase [Mameliella alba]MBY6122466.1 protein-glutamate O-methyltransferase [Mameliella alba]OWV39581.1 chemotaxis protein [Mameliella alba]OWV54703.1 chemotaxis protein [Mameliella alba]